MTPGMDFDAQSARRKLYPLQVEARDVEAWLLEKEPQAIGSYRELGAEEYARAFTAARTAATDIASDLYFGLVDTVSRGGDERDFSKLVTPILREKGWLGGDERQIGRRISLIFDTNLNLARAAGRWGRIQATKSALPYLRGITVGDQRVRQPPKSEDDHTAFEGITLEVDHPFWLTYWPPLGFRCRCAVVQMTRSEFARRKGGLTSEAELAERIARIGPPVFATPGAPMAAALAQIIGNSTKPKMPGFPFIDADQAARTGAALWQEILAQQSFDDVSRALADLFGLAA